MSPSTEKPRTRRLVVAELVTSTPGIRRRVPPGDCGRATTQGFAAARPGPTAAAGLAHSELDGQVRRLRLARGRAWTNSTAISGKVPAEIARLEQEPGGAIASPGAPTLVRPRATHDLVGEYRLMVHSITRGSGMRFVDAPRSDLLYEPARD